MKNIQAIQGTSHYLTSVNGYSETVIFQIKKVSGCTPRNLHFGNISWIKWIIQNIYKHPNLYILCKKAKVGNTWGLAMHL